MSLYNDLSDEQKFEWRVRSLIFTSIDDARISLKFASKEVMIEALKRERESKFPRSTMIKMLESALRRGEKEEE